MNFKQATDALLESVTLENLAKEMGVSVQSLRQARAAEGSTSFRSPPPNWENAVAKLAAAQARKFQRLLERLH